MGHREDRATDLVLAEKEDRGETGETESGPDLGDPRTLLLMVSLSSAYPQWLPLFLVIVIMAITTRTKGFSTRNSCAAVCLFYF